MAMHHAEPSHLPGTYYQDASNWPEMDSDLESDANDYDIVKKPESEDQDLLPKMVVPGVYMDPVYFGGAEREAMCMYVGIMCQAFKQTGVAPSLDFVGHTIRETLLNKHWAMVYMVAMRYHLGLDDWEREQWVSPSQDVNGKVVMFLPIDVDACAGLFSHEHYTLAAVPASTFFHVAEMVQRASNNEF